MFTFTKEQLKEKVVWAIDEAYKTGNHDGWYECILNAQKQEVKPERWKPTEGEKFFFIDSTYSVEQGKYDSNSGWCTKIVNSQNCFQTISPAIRARDLIKKTLEEFHEKEAENGQNQ